MSLPDLTTVIRAVNEATAPLREVAASLHHVQHAAHGASAEMERMEHPHVFQAITGHVTLLRGHFGELRTSIGEVGKSFTEFLPMLGALAGAGSAVGLFEMVEHAAEARSELTKMASQLGITAQALQSFNYIGKASDVPVEEMQTSMGKLNLNLAKAAGGHNKDLVALFHHLHISMRDAHGSVRSVSDLMPELADAFQHAHTPAMRSIMAFQLFGRSGQALIHMMQQGGEEMRKMAALAETLNYAPKPEELEAQERFHVGMIGLQTAVAGLTDEIGAKLAPVLAPIVEDVRDWIAAHRDWIATHITEKITELADSLRDVARIAGGLDWSHPITALRDLAGEVFNAHGSLSRLAEIAAGFGVVAAAPFVAALIDVGQGIVGLGALMLTNPFGLILTATAGAAVAAYELWNHWDWVKGQFAALFEWFSSQSGWVQGLMTAFVPFVGLPLVIAEHWQPIKAFFATLWADVTGIFDGAWQRIAAIGNSIGSVASHLMHPFRNDAPPAPSVPTVPVPPGLPAAPPRPAIAGPDLHQTFGLGDGLRSPVPALPGFSSGDAPFLSSPVGPPQPTPSAPVRTGAMAAGTVDRLAAVLDRFDPKVRVQLDVTAPPGSGVNTIDGDSRAKTSVNLGENATHLGW